MDIKTEYYISRYEELSVLSDTEKGKTVLVKNTDTGELAVKKTMESGASKVYNRLKTINNQNMAKVYDCFTIDENCVVFEEYINGKRLDSIIANSPLNSSQAVQYEMQLCNALSDVHKMGIIHRDIHPKNIIVTNDGVLKLIDFDIARQEKNGASKDTQLWGTAGYAAPEQYGFAQTSERSDIYSMGVLLRTMLTGKQDGDLEALKRKTLEYREKVNITKLENIIQKCTEIDSRNRYENVKELAKALKETIVPGKEKEKETEEPQLPKITWKYVLRTIPGFRSGNIIFEIFAMCMYGMFIWAFGTSGWNLPVIWIRKIYAVIMLEAFFIVPYVYLTNIAHIAQRFPKMKFKTKGFRILYQIVVSFIWMLLIVIVIGLTLPIEANNQ